MNAVSGSARSATAPAYTVTTMPMVASETPRSALIVPSNPTGMSSVVMAKNVASPSTAMPTIDWVVTVIGRVFVDTAEVVVLVDTLLTSSGARASARRCRSGERR